MLGAGALLAANLMVGIVVAVLEKLFESELAGLVLTVAGSVVPVVVGVFFIGVLYRYTPDVEIGWRSVWMAAVAMALLAAGTSAYGLYLEKFGLRHRWASPVPPFQAWYWSARR